MGLKRTYLGTSAAAAAEAAGLVVFHYDRDFDFIATVTGQRTEWVLPAGAVP